MWVIPILAAMTGPSAMPAVEHLGRPCRARNVLAGQMVVDASGRESLVLTNMNETSGAELIFIDMRSGAGKVYKAPAGAGSWALHQASDRLLVVGTFYDGRFLLFDLRSRRFSGVVPFPGESYIWNLAAGGDGRLYGGTYPGGKLGALDLGAQTVEDCGAAAPPNMYLRNVSSLPDGRILCSYIAEQPTELIYDPGAKRYDKPPATLAGVTIGATWNGYFIAGSSVYAGSTLDRVVPPPFPLPGDGSGWAVDAYLTTPKVLWLRQAGRVYRYEAGDASPKLVSDVELRGGRLLAGTVDGGVAGVRGQDYFVLRNGATDLDLKPIPGQSGPRPTLFLRAGSSETVWGGPHFGQTLFHLDLRTKKAVNTSTVSDNGGEVYDVAMHDGVVYGASYAGGEIIRYDPGEPWDQWNHRNPRTIASLGEQGYIRPTGGILVGRDGKLYSGWMAKYGVYGGAIAITDPANGTTDIIGNPLGEQAVAGLVVSGAVACVGTSLGANGLPNKTGESARFGIIDLATKQPRARVEISGASTVRVLTCDEETRRVVIAVDGKLEARDLDSAGRVSSMTDVPRLTCNCVAEGSSGLLLYASGKDVVALRARDGAWCIVASAPDNITNVAWTRGGSIVLSCGADLYRLRRTAAQVGAKLSPGGEGR